MYILINNITANVTNTTATRFKADDNILTIIFILWAIIASPILCVVNYYTRKY